MVAARTNHEAEISYLHARSDLDWPNYRTNRDYQHYGEDFGCFLRARGNILHENGGVLDYKYTLHNQRRWKNKNFRWPSQQHPPIEYILRLKKQYTLFDRWPSETFNGRGTIRLQNVHLIAVGCWKHGICVRLGGLAVGHRSYPGRKFHPRLHC